MVNTLVHRGPDDCGIWLDTDKGVALGHRRLSILDLSPQGHQPMVSTGGRFIIVFNGEIYNHLDIRKKLEVTGLQEQSAWRGRSDTETILAAIAAWGIDKTLRELIGMFAFAVWDRNDEVLTLARDRVGEKPLYYWIDDRTFAFGSELKALAKLPGINLDVSRASMGLFLQYGYIPAPYSIYEKVKKLEPAKYLKVELRNERAIVDEPTRYWQVGNTTSPERFIDEARATDQLHELLKDAVGRQMVADVPLGAFLSGGVDSSLVVALMQAQSSRPVKTFTIGFSEADFDEAPFAHDVARQLGTDHTELYVTPLEAASVIPRVPAIYDEPFADSSQIPTILLAQLTRQHVKVSLSGDGGDELFGGYPRYQFAENLWNHMTSAPHNLRTGGASALTAFSPRTWDRILSPLLPRKYRQSFSGHRFHRLAEVVTANDFGAMYERLLAQWQHPSEAVLKLDRDFTDLPFASTGESPFEQMRHRDFMHYLPDDILVKVDRATMAASLESRAPLLDHRVVEFAFSLPKHLLLRGRTGKWLLRQVLYRLVPRHLIERPKAGFAIPLGEWLQGPLREWAENLLSEDMLRRQGFFDVNAIRRTWKEHLSGRHNRQTKLWTILMFQAWYCSTR